MTDELRKTQLKVFKSIQFLRLILAKRYNDAELQSNQSVAVGDNDGFFKSLFTSIENGIKNEKTKNLLYIKRNIDEAIETFRQNSSSTSMAVYHPEQLSGVINYIFSNDPYSLERTMFSISIIFDGEYQYEYANETLGDISKIIWEDESFLLKIKSGIEAIYKELAKQPLSTNQKLILGGTAALALFTAAVPALALGGLSASGITGGLATFGAAMGVGGTMVEGVGLMAIAELLLDGALIGFTYALLDSHNKNSVKQSFREMNFNSVAQMLAIKCYIMNVAKQTMPESLYKEKTSEMLQMIQDLKSDTDYVLLIENQNIEENKKKIRVFHNLDEKMAKIFC